MISAGVLARLFLKAAPNPEQYNLSKCLRQSSARGRREGFTRLERENAVPNRKRGAKREQTGAKRKPKAPKRLQRRKKKTKMKPKGTKRVPKNPKGAKREPKDAKRERQGDQNGSKNRLGRQGRFWKQKVDVAREF